MADFGVLKYYNYSCVVSMKLFRSRRRFLQVLSLLAFLVQKCNYRRSWRWQRVGAVCFCFFAAALVEDRRIGACVC